LGGHLSTRVCDLLDCRYPVVLAGMGGVARSELVAAITNAGGFGFLGMVREPPSLIRKEVEAVRRATSRRFGVNLIPAATDSELLERQLRMCIDLAVPVVAGSLFRVWWNVSATQAFSWSTKWDRRRRLKRHNAPALMS
jgi:NAD(P)H-dependent flavin oxidoreductase YrpB (nitropropane dioxygenase family)